MPREGDLFGQKRGGDDLHSPLRGLLNFTDPLDSTVLNAGQLIIQGIINQITDFFDGLGLDFSSPEAFLNSLLNVPTNLLNNFTGDGTFGSWLGDIADLLGNPLGLGSGNPILPDINDIPILGPVIDYILSLPGEIWDRVTEFISRAASGDVGGAAGLLIDWITDAIGITGDGGVLGFIENIGANIFGIFGDPTGSGSLWDTFLTCVGPMVGGPIQDVIDTVSGIVQFVVGLFNKGVPGGGLVKTVFGSDCTNVLRVPAGIVNLGTFTPSSIVTDLFGFFGNPDGLKCGSLFDAVTRPIWNFINCGGLFGDSFTLSQNITGVLSNPAGMSFGSLVDGLCGLVCGWLAPVCDFLTGASDWSPSQILTSLFGNPFGLSTGSLWDSVVGIACSWLAPVCGFLLGAQDFSVSSIITSLFGNPAGLSTGSLWDTVVACVCGLLAPVCDFFIGSQGFSISSILTSIFGNPGGLSTGSLFDTVINCVKNLCTCGGLLGKACEIAQGVLGIFGNPTGFSLGSIAGAVTGCLSSALGLAGGLLGVITSLAGGNISGLLNFIGTPFDPSMLLGASSPLMKLIKGLGSFIGLGDTTGGVGGLFGTATNFIGDFMSMFGNPGNLGTAIPGIDLKPFEQIPILGQLMTMNNGSALDFLSGNLTPAGALASFTQLPAHLFGLIMPTGDSNMAPPFTADTINGEGLWSWNSTLNAIQTMADGTLKPMLGVAFPVNANQTIQAGIDTIWSGLVASGLSIQVAIYAYQASPSNPNLPGSFIGQVSSLSIPPPTISNPAASGSATLSGKFVMPAGTKFARLLLQVEANVITGSVAFKNPVFEPTQVLDAGLLGNMFNIPVVPGTNVEGAQGIFDILGTFGHLADGLGSAFTPAGSATNIDFSTLFGLAQGTRQDATTALDSTVVNTQILGIRNNEDLGAALDPTAESSFDLTTLPHGSSMPTITVTAGNARAAQVTMKRSALKGIIRFMASGSGLTNIFVNLYSIDTTNGNKALLYSTPNIAGDIPTSLGWVTEIIPTANQISVDPGQIIIAEFVNNGSNALTIGYKQIPNLSLPGMYPPHYGATRVLASTGGVSPSTLTHANHTYSGDTPFISIGINNLPTDYQPPKGFEFTSSQTHTAPSWWRPGIDFVDRIVLSSGGAGGSYTTTANSGNPTSIAVSGASTLSAAGGAAGSSAVGVSSTAAQGVGPSPSTETFNGQSYFGGGTVASGSNGSPPGGAGSGGNNFGFYTPGGSPGNWNADTIQPSGTVFTITIGAAAVGQVSGNGYRGYDSAAGKAWLLFYQNTAV